ncbi:SLAM family member 5-like isoform X1 [Brienomyrus brachyistius]|uniref:SLAM family member 5-like isoform X1 n=1 Tax=Brienomyrus brachyistius TaxID=42636 RepID=UPI0020B298C4|nr:SLAM family member 5-like isoform X1 [Brienomyrus brachyistius]XP_048826942.1 SLAM family member 5-like isoform X1 [Brienomyrus brachyistius]
MPRIRTLLFIIICGVCVAADLTVNGSVGGTVELPSALGSLKVEDFQSLRWKFKNIDIAEKLSGQTEVNLHAQFKRRLQLSPDFSLTVRELRLEDSGEYHRVGRNSVGLQIPTYTIQLQVYENITVVYIQSKVTWLQVNHSCGVHLVCSSSGNPEASFSWTKGTHTENSKEMHFFLSPEEGDISITCTAANAVSRKATNVTIGCSPTDWKMFLYIGLSAAVSLTLISLAVYCCCRRHRGPAADADRDESTVYSTVNDRSIRQSHESDSQNSPITLYETIGEQNVKPQTVYDRVDFNRSCAPAPSPLKKVL